MTCLMFRCLPVLLCAMCCLTVGCAPANPVDPGTKSDAITPPDPSVADPTYDVEWPRWLGVGADTQVAIKQDGELLPIHAGQVQLQAKPFVIVVRLPVGKVLWLHAMTQPTFTNALRSGQRVYDLVPFAANGMAEYGKNRRRTLALAEDRYNLWMVMDEDDHRFDPDSIAIADGIVTAERTVEFYHDVTADGAGDDKEKPIAELGGLDKKDLFLVFFRTGEEIPDDVERYGGGPLEIGRAYLELKFE